MHTRSRRLVVAALMGALLLTGCDRSGDRSAAPDSVIEFGYADGQGACGLLTTEEVEEALGTPVEVDTQTAIDCLYVPTGGAAAQERDITVTVVPLAGQSTDVFEQLMFDSASPDGTADRVSGLGDAAVLVVEPYAAVLHVKDGGAWLTITAYSVQGTMAVDVLTGLAARAVQRLP